MTLEKEVEKYLIRQVEKIGGKCLKIPATYEEGIPDRLVIIPYGRIVFVEMKRPKGGKLSDVQRYQHKKLRALGCEVYVLKNNKEVDEFINEVQSTQLPTVSHQ